MFMCMNVVCQEGLSYVILGNESQASKRAWMWKKLKTLEVSAL